MDLDELQKLEEYLEKIEQEELHDKESSPSTLDDLLGEMEETEKPTQPTGESATAEETPEERSPSLEELLGEPLEIPELNLDEVREKLKKKKEARPKEEIPLEEALKVIEQEEAETTPTVEKSSEKSPEVKIAGIPYTEDQLLKLKATIEALPYPIKVAYITAIMNDMFSESQLKELVELAIEDSPPEVFVKFLIENIPPGRLRRILPVEPIPLSVRIAEELGLEKYREQIAKFFQKLPAYLTGFGVAATVITSLYVFVAMPILSMKYAYAGIEALREARFETSQMYLQKALRLSPDPVSVVLMYFFEYLRLKMYDKALSLASMYREDPRIKSAMAYYYLETTNYERALEEAQLLIKEGSEDPLAYITAYRAARILGEKTLAEKYLREAQKKFPNDSLVLTETIKTLLEKGKTEQAGRIFEKLKRITSPKVLSYDVLIELGEKALRARNMDLASEVASYLRAKAGNDPNVQIFLAEYDVEIGTYREAFHNLERLEKVMPSFWKIYSMKGKAALGIARTTITKDETLKYLDIASSNFERALQLNPSDASSWVGLGDIRYYFFRKFDEADSYYFRAYSLGYYHPKFYFNYGVTRYEAGNIETALNLWKNRKEDMETPALIYNMATAYLLKKEEDRALGLYQYLIRMKKGEKRNYMLSKAYNNMGVILARKGELTKAMAAFVKASEFAYHGGRRNPYSQANMNLVSSLPVAEKIPSRLLQELQINSEPEWYENKEDLPLSNR